MSKTLPFSYFGSKYRSFEFINDKLPRTRQYIEPFGGAGTILLNRDPVPVETYNDLHDDLPHFFRTLRDNREELLRSLRETPYSRSEYSYAIEQRRMGYPACSNVERARLFFTIMQQSRSNRQYSGSSAWSYVVKANSYSGTDKTTTPFKKRVEDVLPEIAGRLRDLQIENRPAIEIIETHDTDTATFYVDPPYLPDTRGSADDYQLELSREDHRELATVLTACEGYVALSGYSSDLYNELYGGWNRYYANEKSAGDGDGTRQEVLWTNYDADELGGRKIGDWPEPTRKGKQLTLTGTTE